MSESAETCFLIRKQFSDLVIKFMIIPRHDSIYDIPIWETLYHQSLNHFDIFRKRVTAISCLVHSIHNFKTSLELQQYAHTMHTPVDARIYTHSR